MVRKMSDEEYLRRVHAAYFHLQALAEQLGNNPRSAVVRAADALAVVYMDACSALGVDPWDIKPWTGPANRSWEPPPS